MGALSMGHWAIERMTQRKARAKSPSKTRHRAHIPNAEPRTTISRPLCPHPRDGNYVDNGRPRNARTQAAPKACLTVIEKRRSNLSAKQQKREQQRQ